MSTYRNGATKENKKTAKISINESSLGANKSILLISSDSLFLAEMADLLKRQKAAVNYCWTMSSFINLPMQNIDLAIFASDAWGARNFFVKNLKSKLEKLPQVFVLSHETIDICAASQLENVEIISDFETFEDLLKQFLQSGVKKVSTLKIDQNLVV